MISGCTSANPGAEPISYALEPEPERGLNPAFRREHVHIKEAENHRERSIVVNTSERFLYHVEEGGWATRYGVAVGEQGLTLKGKATIGNKVEWPAWSNSQYDETQTAVVEYAEGLKADPEIRLARVHFISTATAATRCFGCTERTSWTIGTAVSNGCVRLTNEDIVDLYQRVPMGATVLVI